MQFLNPSLLLPLLPLVALPFLIHWLSRRYPKKFAFSSIDEIRRTLAGRSRMFKWRHLLMMALRTAALALLLLAFLQPLLDTPATVEDGRRHVILLVDHSLSMTHRESGTSARAKALAEARRLLDSLDPDDPFNLIRVDHAPTSAFPAFDRRRGAALAFLEDSPPPRTRADFTAANHLAATLAAEADGPVDVYYFSDFQRRNWADVRFDPLPADTRLFFVAATDDPQRPNRAITKLALGQGAVIAGGEIEVRATVANFAPEPWSGKIEAGFAPEFLREKHASLAPWSETEVSLRVPVPASGLLALNASLPGDRLAADDQRHLAVRVSQREDVVILTGPPADPSVPEPSLFLTTAVDPYGDDRGVYRPRRRDPDALAPSTLAATSRVLASRLPPLTDDQAAVLAGFLRGGGGLILFLDGESDPANLEKLAAQSGETLPLRLADALDSGNLPGGAMRVASGDFDSRFLRLFRGERRQNLGHLEFYHYYHAIPTGAGRILLTYADGTPALAEATVGTGTLLLCNFSVAEASSNLARQRLFPAWIHEMLLRMANTGSAALEPYRVGETMHGETWTAEAAGRDLIGPDGTPARSRQSSSGERLRVSAPAEATGIYRMEDHEGRTLLAFAANTDPDQSDLRSIDPEVLPGRAGGGSGARPAANLAGGSDFSEILRGRPVYHWFLLAALAFLLLEGVLFKSAPAARAAANP